MTLTKCFASFAEYLAAACGKSRLSDNRRSSRNGTLAFTGTPNFNAAVELATNGWHEGAEKVRALATQLREQIIGSLTEAQVAQWDVTGAGVDVGRFVEGEPECMIDFVPDVVQAPAKFLRLTVNYGASCAISPDEIIRRGAAAVALIDVLESRGYRVEVDALRVTTGRGGRASLTTVVRVKETGEPVEIDRLAFVLAHPSMLRRLEFGWMEAQESALRDGLGAYTGGGYGRNQPTPEAIKGDINIEALRFGTDSESAAWVIGQLKEYGIEIA